MSEAEIAACAALRIARDGGVELVLAGKRHVDCISMANYAGFTDRSKWEYGFMTTRGRFVDRREAFLLMQRAGIASACPSGYRTGLGDLFSEDLY